VGRFDVYDDDSGCPECGSHCLRRVEGPDARSGGNEAIDIERSGYYVCERCMTEHYAEFPKEKPKPPADNLTAFSPTAKCPQCACFDTIVSYAYAKGGTRTHKCRGCGHGFKTRMVDK